MRLGVLMASIHALPRPSAQVIDFQAARLAAGRDPAPMRAFAIPRPDLLSPQEIWALQAVDQHLSDRGIVLPADPIEAAWNSQLGRFELPKYIAAAIGDLPIVQPLPAGRASLVERLFGGAL